MKITFSQEEIEGYFKDRKEAKHHFYDAAVNIAKKMAVHADGVFPGDLLKERRPNEPKEVLEYREKIWVPKTKPTFSKVYSELQKIRRSSDWSIKYENQDQFTLITDEQNLETYCEKNFPYFDSITNWVFSLMLRKELIDPNAVVVVMPIEWEVEETDLLQPFPVIFDSAKVIDFKSNDYVVLNNPEGAIYYVRGVPTLGKSIYVITTLEVLRYDQINAKGEFQLVVQVPHELGVLPAFSLRGILIDQAAQRFLYESRLAGMIPDLDEAVREYSDLQAAKVLHIYPERWEATNTECKACIGTGRRPNPSWTEACGCDKEIECNKCDGHGYTVAGPYSKIRVKMPTALEPGTNFPTPPAGYVEKDVEIVRIQDEGVRQHVYDALSAINFEFLAEVPLSQSGKAKEVDMDALNNTVHSIAEDIVWCMDNLYKLIAYWRYKGVYAIEKINDMLPSIGVPEKFNILTSAQTMEELTSSKNNKANSVIISALEIDYASKRFNNDPEVRDMVTIILKLDPLSNISEDEKMSRLSNKGITQIDYVISSNIQQFVQRAINENKKFPKLKLEEQQAVLKKYAQEIISQNAPVVTVPVNTGLEEIADDGNV